MSFNSPRKDAFFHLPTRPKRKCTAADLTAVDLPTPKRLNIKGLADTCRPEAPQATIPASFQASAQDSTKAPIKTSTQAPVEAPAQAPIRPPARPTIPAAAPRGPSPPSALPVYYNWFPRRNRALGELRLTTFTCGIFDADHTAADWLEAIRHDFRRAGFPAPHSGATVAAIAMFATASVIAWLTRHAHSEVRTALGMLFAGRGDTIIWSDARAVEVALEDRYLPRRLVFREAELDGFQQAACESLEHYYARARWFLAMTDVYDFAPEATAGDRDARHVMEVAMVRIVTRKFLAGLSPRALDFRGPLTEHRMWLLRNSLEGAYLWVVSYYHDWYVVFLSLSCQDEKKC